MDKEARQILAFSSGEAFEAWLAAEAETSLGIWLKIAKKDSGIESIDYGEAVDVALCFGWIDGQKDRFDEQYWLQRFTPRRSRSKWSQVNRTRVAKLVAAGRMRPAGLAEVERAKADGRWDAAYAPQSTATVPEDLRQALSDDPEAADFFAVLDSANRYAVLYRIGDAKRPTTRPARIRKYVDMLHNHQKIYPDR